jgi:hypothetical protein
MLSSVPFASLVSTALVVAAAAQAPSLQWRSAPTTVESLQKDSPAAVVGKWSAFAVQHGYRLILSDDAQVLLVLSGTFARRQPKKEHNEVDAMPNVLAGSIAAVGQFAPSKPGVAPVVVVSAKTATYPALALHVARLDPRLQDWANGAGKVATGFILSEPLVGAWIEDPVGVERGDREGQQSDDLGAGVADRSRLPDPGRRPARDA